MIGKEVATVENIKLICSVVSALGVICGGVYVVGVLRGQVNGLVTDMELLKNHLFPSRIPTPVPAEVGQVSTNMQTDLTRVPLQRNR